MYDRTTVQGATFNMRGQLYRGHANATALFSSPVVSALGSESDNPRSSPGRGKALCPWDVRGKKMRAPLLGLAKTIYNDTHSTIIVFIHIQQNKHIRIITIQNSQAVNWTVLVRE